MKTQTAVEYLVSELPSIDWENSYWQVRLEKAKEMENQQQVYSAEEVLKILLNCPTNTEKETIEWFKQFSKENEQKKDYYAECNVCKAKILNQVGSTDCCGAIAYCDIQL